MSSSIFAHNGSPYFIELAEQDDAVFIKFYAKWKFGGVRCEWPEWLFVKMGKEKDEKTGEMKLYANDIYDIWHGVHLLWLFGLASPVRRLATKLLNSGFVKKMISN